MPVKLDGATRRGGFYHVDPEKIIVRDGWNPRQDFEGHADLMASIIENGVQVPLRVRRGQDDAIVLIDGERRLRAVLAAREAGHDIQAVPAIFERNGMSDVEAMVLAPGDQ